MQRIKRVAAGVGFLLALVSAAAWGRAQAVSTQPSGHVVVSGSDVGFRIEGMKAGKPVGRLVIRQKGEWVEVETPFEMRAMSGK